MVGVLSELVSRRIVLDWFYRRDDCFGDEIYEPMKRA